MAHLFVFVEQIEYRVPNEPQNNVNLKQIIILIVIIDSDIYSYSSKYLYFDYYVISHCESIGSLKFHICGYPTL